MTTKPTTKTATKPTTKKASAKKTSSETSGPSSARSSAANLTRRIRFLPDPNTLAELGFKMPDGRQIMLFGLVLNESQTGCAVVLVTEEKLRQDHLCLCKIGKMAQGYAIVRWVTLIDKNLMKIGIEYT